MDDTKERNVRVSVLVPVYRTNPGVLRETIASVLAQTFRDFELILLDDCPADPRADVVRSFADERIRYEVNPQNLGISATRNRLMDLARGEYWAVLDHDDVCRADRLAQEVVWLDAHPDCGVVSSWTREIPSGRIVERPVEDADIRVLLMGGCVIAHSASMLRASVLKEHGVRYEAEFSPSEDYRLYLRLLDKTTFHAIPEPLLDYRIHEGNTTQAQSDKMWRTAEAAQAAAKASFPALFSQYESRPRVLVSGGWSYGNLGDDALLEATARLVRRNLPTADVTWAVYDTGLAQESGVALGGRVVPSIHRLIDRRRSFWMMQTVGRSTGHAAWPKLLRKAFVKVVHPLAVALSAATDRVADSSDAFRGTDLFIMSGGGYFNLWATMFDARIRELELAHTNGCRVLLVGQSIGPFTEEQREILRRTLRPTDVICVRDPESVAELASLGFSASLAPDLALGFPQDAVVEKGLMTVVLGELDRRRERLVAEQLAEFHRRTGGRFRLRLTQTCNIWSDVMALRHVAQILRSLGVAAEVVMPRSYPELQKAIEGSEWVVSRRMHGMVLGWRSGSQVFAFTKSRKIVGFLEAIGSPDNICAEADWPSLAERLERAVSETSGETKARRAELAQQVQSTFAKLTQELLGSRHGIRRDRLYLLIRS